MKVDQLREGGKRLRRMNASEHFPSVLDDLDEQAGDMEAMLFTSAMFECLTIDSMTP